MNYITYRLLPAVLILTFSHVFWAANTAEAQDQPPSILLDRQVRNPDGSLNERTPPEATFTAFLNEDHDSVLVENAPRWKDDLPNLQEGQGTFSIQLGNFPNIAVGDTAHIRFTDNAIGAQGRLSVPIHEIPWNDPNPLGSLNLENASFPERPDGVSLQSTGSGELTLSWQAEQDLSYSVYRRMRTDTIFNGESRYLYTRLDSGITEGSYIDQISGDPNNYAYIIYATNESGVYSSHTAEVGLSRPVTGLATDPTATTVRLSWDSYQPTIGSIGGYQIYRRTEGETFGNPIAYTSADTQYTDTRLKTGTTYYYKVEARNLNQEFIGLSEEVSVTTGTDTSKYHRYATLKLAAIFYLKTNSGSISESYIESLKEQYKKTRRFYWRNSGMRFNTEIDFYVVRDKANISSVSIPNVAHQLQQRGVYNTQYDMVFAAWPLESGFWSIGDGANLDLPGPDRNTGFAQIALPCGTGVGYPTDPQNRCGVWLYMHENQHTIDAIYASMGSQSMPHGDFPQAYYQPAGHHLDFQASMFRYFDEYLNLNRRWGDIYEARDADNDGIPDNDPRAPIDEQDFGSDPSKKDTDGDGLNDLEEAMDGIYWGSNPTLADTDGDSVIDGRDDHPRYPIDSYIKKLPDTTTITVDGDLGEWNNLDAQVSRGMEYVFKNNFDPKVHMTYSSDSLYIALDLPHVAIPELRFEFEGDGRWHGAGNTRISVNISEGTFDTFRSWDARPEVRQYVDDNPDDQYPGNGMWDNTSDYREQFSRRVINPGSASLATSVNWPRVDVELAIPRNEDAGLPLVPGDSIGWNIYYGKVNNKPDNWGTNFDNHSFVYFDLIDDHVTKTERSREIASNFELNQNYPNPFNPTTRISYSIPKTQDVSLKVYNLLGREVATLVDGVQEAGKHKVQFSAENLASGVYLYRLRSGGQSKVQKMILTK